MITPDDAGHRIGRTLKAVEALDRCHGFFYAWYDPRTGERLQTWPGGQHVRPFLSSVDNAWLAAALMMVANARPELRAPAQAILGPMNFAFFYDAFDAADPANHPGLLRGGYYPEEGAYTQFHYGQLNTEPRIASYIGIARGDLPADHYFRMKRGDEDASSPRRSYCKVSVSEGARSYRNTRVLPSWDGTMFEALMVSLFVPEAAWSQGSWGLNHANYARVQLEYGLNDARLGFWGVSASTDGGDGYEPFGIGPLSVGDRGRATTSVITPHASFLALGFLPRQAMDNLAALAAKFPVYGDYGFQDAVDVRAGRVSSHILTLDQGMIMAAIANALGDNVLQKAFSTGAIKTVIEPLIAPEEFGLQETNLAALSRPVTSVSEPMETLGALLPTTLFAAPPALLNFASPTPRRQNRGKSSGGGASRNPAEGRSIVRRVRSRSNPPRGPRQGRAA